MSLRRIVLKRKRRQGIFQNNPSRLQPKACIFSGPEGNYKKKLLKRCQLLQQLQLK